MKAYRAARETDDGGVSVNAALQAGDECAAGQWRSVRQKVSQIANALKPVTNPNMASDLITAVALAGAALTGALSNVEINLGSMKAGFAGDDAFVSETRTRAAQLETQRG